MDSSRFYVIVFYFSVNQENYEAGGVQVSLVLPQWWWKISPQTLFQL